MILDYYKMKEKHQRKIMRMYSRRAAGEMTKEQFLASLNQMIRQEDSLVELDQYGTGFLADMATDYLYTSGLTKNDDLWPWIARTFRICWSEWCDNERIKNAVTLACIRIFGRNNES